MVIFPCAVQYILVTYFIYGSLYLIYISYNCPSPFPLPAGNHKFSFCVCESVSVLLYSSFVYFIF